MDVFLDGPEAKVRDAVHILWAGEKAVPDAIEPTPGLGATEPGDGFALVPLDDLVRMKLTSFRDKDRMHLRDLAAVGPVELEESDGVVGNFHLRDADGGRLGVV